MSDVPTGTPQRPSSERPDAADREGADTALHLAPGGLRGLLLVTGFVFVGLAGLGAVLPVLPTTPFLLVAAACFARSSPRFYAWLLSNRLFGPLIRDWRAHRTIPRGAKVWAIGMIAVVGGSSVAFFLTNPWARLAVGATLLALIGWLLWVPTSENVRRAGAARPGRSGE